MGIFRRLRGKAVSIDDDDGGGGYTAKEEKGSKYVRSNDDGVCDQVREEKKLKKRVERLEKNMGFLSQNAYLIGCSIFIAVILFYLHSSSPSLPAAAPPPSQQQEQDTPMPESKPQPLHNVVEIDLEKLRQMAQEQIIVPTQVDMIWQFLIAHQPQQIKETTDAALRTEPPAGDLNLFSVTSILYCVAVLAMSTSAAFLIHAFWHHGAAVASITFIYSVLFLAVAQMLVEFTSSSIIGGMVYLIPVGLSPLTMLGILKAARVWAFPDIDTSRVFTPELRSIVTWRIFRSFRSLVLHIALFIYFALSNLRTTLPVEFLRLSLLLQGTVVATALVLNRQCGFPLLQLCVVVSLVFFTTTVVETSPLKHWLTSKKVVPTWLWTTSVFGVFSVWMTFFSATRQQNGFAFGLSIAGSCVNLFALPFLILMMTTKLEFGQMNLHDSLALIRAADEPQQTETRTQLQSRKLFGLCIYVLVNVFLLAMSVRFKSWSFIPSAQLGLIISMYFLPTRSGWFVAMYRIAIGFVLLRFNLALNGIHDPVFADFISWVGGQDQLSINALLKLGSILAAAFAIFGACTHFYRLWMPNLTALSAISTRVHFQCVAMTAAFTLIGHGFGTFASLESSTYGCAILELSSATMFVISLSPIWTLTTQHRHDDAHSSYLVGIAVLYALSMRMVIASSLSDNSVGYYSGLLGLALNQYDLLTNPTALVFRHGSKLIATAQSVSLIVLAVILNAPGLAFAGIVCCYATLASIGMRYSKDAVGRAILFSLLGVSTFHFALAFQQYYSTIEQLVLQRIPSVVLEWIAS